MTPVMSLNLPLKTLPSLLACALLPCAQAQQATPTQLAPIHVKGEAGLHPATARDALDNQLRLKRYGVHELARPRASSPDASSLLTHLPGVEVYQAGGISSLPVIHGLGDERLRLSVDEMELMAACANHMNPVLSYIDPAKVESIKVYAGVAPVSAGGDSIGGSVQLESAPPEFAKAGTAPRLGGRLGANYRHNGRGWDAHTSAFWANERFHLSYNGTHAQADNYHAAREFKPTAAGREQGRPIPGDEVASSAFRSRNHQAGLAWLSGKHLIEAQLSAQDIPFQGFPNQRMDMTANRATLGNLRYRGQFGWGDLKLRTWHQRIRHQMDMGDDRYLYGTGMPMRTSASTTGAAAQANWLLSEHDTVRAGLEALHYTLYDWWPPAGASGVMAPNDFWNIDYGRRHKYSGFLEWESQRLEDWVGVAGIRHTQVRSQAGPVQGYNEQPTWAEDAHRFNDGPRHQHDRHWDLSVLLSHRPTEGRRHDIGLARKTRSPSLYERYPWSTNTMAAGMNNFVGDGNGYLGNPELKPEVAHTISLEADWRDPAETPDWALTVNAHLSRIHNYVDAERCPAERCRSGNADDTRSFVLLRHANQEARLHGLDVSGEYLLAPRLWGGSWRLTGVFSWLRGKNLSTGSGLYNTMPPNLKLGLAHRRPLAAGTLSGTLEWQGVRAKRHTSSVRNEIRTAGYGLVHLRARYELGAWTLDAGIENLLNQHHSLPLGGAYVGQGSSMMLNTVPWGIAVPGPGRSIHAGFSLRF